MEECFLLAADTAAAKGTVIGCFNLGVKTSSASVVTSSLFSAMVVMLAVAMAQDRVAVSPGSGGMLRVMLEEGMLPSPERESGNVNLQIVVVVHFG